MANMADKVVFWSLNRLIYTYNNILHHGASSGEFQMIRTEVFKKIGGFNEALVGGEDFDMFARLSKVGLTQSVPSLTIFHTSRRAHKIGWPRLLWSWILNWFHATFLNKSYSTVWEEIR